MKWSLFIYFVLLINTAHVNAELSDAAFENCRAATVLVQLPNRRGFGTAFRVHSDGYFLTSDRVVIGAEIGRKMTMVTSAGTGSESSVTATVAHLDRLNKLALLFAPDAAGPASVSLGDDTSLRETKPVTVFGYGFGNSTAVRTKKYTAIAVNVGRIATLSGNRRAPTSIQAEIQTGPGRLGGPMVTDDGKLIGVIVSADSKSKTATAVPVSHIRQFLQTPKIDFESPDVQFADRYQPVQLRISADTTLPQVGMMQSVSVQVSREGKTETIPATRNADGTFSATFSPVRKSADPPQCHVEVEFADAVLRGPVMDRPLNFDGQAIRISDIKLMTRHGEHAEVQQADGRKTVANWPAQFLHMSVGGQMLQIDISAAHRLTFLSKVSEADSVLLKITATTVEGQTSSVERTIRLTKTGRSVAATIRKHTAGVGLAAKLFQPPEIEPPPLENNRRVIDLPEAFTQICSGGGGRYLFFHLEKSKVIAVFDVSAADVVAEIPLTSSHALMAASLDKLVVVLPGSRLMQRWDLATMERERVAPVPGTNVPRTIMMGSAGNGPFWLWSGGSVQPIDLETLKVVDMEGKVLGGDPRHGYRMMLSADGTTMTGWHNGLSSPPYDLMRISGNTATRTASPFGEGYNGRWMWPNADGRLIFGHDSSVHNHHFRRIAATWLNGANIIPSGDPRYFMLIREAEKKRSNISICTSCDRQIVHTILRAENVSIGSKREWGMFGLQPRVYFIPSAKVLVSLPAGEKEIIVRRLDLQSEIEETGVDYLYVDSFAPVRGYRGQTWEYAITAHSSSPGFQYSLESGPEDFSLSEAGMIRWNIPERFKEDAATAVVSIRDSSGAEVLHTINIDVLSP